MGHAGVLFGKVSFKRNQKQLRYVRLTFDCRRIEWSPNQRGPFKGFPVNAISRIDYGDASRAFRCFEFGRRDCPAPSLCMSICTASRSLDLIASSERDIEVWMLGLNEIVPYRLERQRFTAQEFFLRRAMLRMEVGTCSDAIAGDETVEPDGIQCEMSGSAATGTGVLDAAQAAGSNGRGILRGMPGRWGFSAMR